MKIIKVNLKKRSYCIIVGRGILGASGKIIRGLNIGNDAYIITNVPIKKRYGKALAQSLKGSGIGIKFRLIPDTEKSKSFENAYSIIEDIAVYGRKRKEFIIAFGGGVVGDLAGFIASVYKRGIPYIQIATTLLAQVDSSIGGKTGIDLPEGKNLVGTFFQPKLVLSDVAILTSLDVRQMQSGLTEIIKYGLIKDAALFEYLEKNYAAIMKKDNTTLEFVVERCGSIKAKIVAQDEYEEKGVRTILNFGHTIGHAIEAAGRYKVYNHGEAVALGMLVACDISELMKCADKETKQRLENLLRAVGLPVRIKKIPAMDIIKAHYLDKKFIGSKNRFVLIEKIGKTRIEENIPLTFIKEALKRRN